MIEVEAVTVELGGTEILAEVTMAVSRGEVVGLVGPNGAGKTTLLRTINGYLSPTTGSVSLGGDSLDGLDAAAIGRAVATVPQETAVAFDFDVETVVGMGRHPHLGRFDVWSAADTSAVDAALNQTNTAQFRNRSIDALSGGQRRRVLIAQALAQETPALLLDEPTASLDINHQVRLLSLLRELAAEEKAVLVALHDLELAARFCDRLVLLADGQVRAQGSPAAVLRADVLSEVFGIDVTVEAGSESLKIVPHADS